MLKLSELLKSFICIFLFFPLFVLSQPKKEYSFLELSNLFFDNENNSKKQLTYAELYLKKALLEKNNIEIASAYGFYSMIYASSDSKKALYYIDKSINYSKNENDAFYLMNLYWSKAALLANLFRVEEAIDNYKKAEELALKYNSDFYYAIKINVAKIKSEYLGEVEEAIEIYKQCHNFYKKKENKNKFPTFYRRTLFSMADAYKALHQTDSATYYNRLGYIDSKKNKDEFYQNLFTLNEGANLILKKKYDIAIDSINKAFPYIQKNADILNKLACYYYYGKAYEGYGKKDLASKNFIKVDSIYQKYKNITPEFVSGYPFMIDYYKKVNNSEKQLQYTTTYLEIEHDFQKKYKKFYNSIVKKYEIPKLIKEKENQINTITLLYKAILIVLIIMTFFAVYLIYKNRVNKGRFNKILEQIEFKNKQNQNFTPIEEAIVGENDIDAPSIKVNDFPEEKDESDKENQIGLNINKELIDDLLEKLKIFENEKKYLESGITIQNLAKDYGTNVKYLSKVVNHYKGKSFIHYVNDLRIEFSLIKLKEDKLYRQFTIEALSKEFGFQSKDSFTAAFLKTTGIKPIYFIQQLTKIDA